jgi:ADP-ribose pyrophosphatase
LINVNTTVAFCNEIIGIYLAADLEKTSQHLDEDEFVDVVYCELQELLDMIYSGKITDGKTIAGILAYAQKK